jgi:hypothetical protein
MPEVDNLSIILARPFTVGENIDCTCGKIVFNIYDEEIIP